VDAALGFYAQLQYVDLSHNQLISLPDRGFIQQKKLVELRLTNNKIFKVSNGTFDGLKTITILSLRKNFIEELGASVFTDLVRVEELDLGQNRIRSVDPGTFSGLQHLRVLYLDDNDLAEVPTPALAPLPHLAELSLAINNIKSLPPRAFAPITNLYSLDLHDCRISNISIVAFHGLESLRLLRLSGNALVVTPSSQLSGLERLEELSMGSNYIEVLGDRGFPGLRKLRALDLSNSPRLNLVSAQAFQDLSNLAWLSLSGSPSLSLQSGALLPLTGLRTAHLADLGWTRIDRDLVQWQNLHTLDLASNPLHCDCQLAWLRDVLIAAGNTSKAECATPASLNGKAVQHLPLGHLRCGTRASGEQTLLAGVCVLAGLVTALAIVAAVHCQRRICLSWPPCAGSRASPCCETDSCEKYRGGALTSPRGSPLEQGLEYGGVPGLEGGLQYPSPAQESIYCGGGGGGRGRGDELYYPSSTKSTYCEEDYFLTLSNDRKTFKPIRVCEI